MRIPDTTFASLELSVRVERWPIAGVFTTSRGSKTEAVVVVAELTDGTYIGRGECLPYVRYGESVEGVEALIAAQKEKFSAGISREELQRRLSAGAARNALDCALWDLEAKMTNTPAWKLADIGEPKTVRTAYTISLAEPEVIAQKTKEAAGHTLLKIKLGGDGKDDARLKAVREAAPNADLIIDANESWSEESFAERIALCARFGIKLVEQPLAAGSDEALRMLAHSVVICADESAHTAADIAGLVGKYDAVNIKLDKAGGLTEVLRMCEAARDAHMQIMIGCMVATSLSMAPAMLLARDAEFVDLDGALLLAKDREFGLVYEGDTVAPASPLLWG